MIQQEGYQASDFGPIPVEWSVQKLGKLFDIKAGGDFDKDVSSPHQSDDHPFPIYSNALTDGGLYGFCSQPRYRPDSITVTARGMVGVAHYRPTSFTAIGRVLVLAPTTEMDPRFFAHFINERISFAIESTGVPQLTAPQLATYEAVYPLVSEQIAVSDTLSDIDSLISSLDALIAKKRDIKQAAMQQLLKGETRLPGFSREWRRSTLGDVLRVRHGRDQKAIQCDDGCFPILATGGEIGRTNTPLYSRPSVLIGRKGTIDRPQFMDQPFWTVDTLFYTEIQGISSALYLFYVFQTIDWRSYNEASGVPSLSTKTIEAISVNLPEPDEQAEIAATLADFDREIDGLEQRSTKFRALREGMMQQLLTGRIRLV